jgi:hypothetical protein
MSERTKDEDQKLQESINDLRAKMLAKAREKARANQPETEEDGIRAESLRRLKVRRLGEAQRDRPPGSSES